MTHNQFKILGIPITYDFLAKIGAALGTGFLAAV